MNGVKEETRENLTEGHAGITTDALPAPDAVMPDDGLDVADLPTASSSVVSSKKPRGRPRKTDVAGTSGPTAATQKRTHAPKSDVAVTSVSATAKSVSTPKRPRASKKMALTAADVPCSHESCQRPTGEDGSKWVTVGF